jgi:hypothetical protein
LLKKPTKKPKNKSKSTMANHKGLHIAAAFLDFVSLLFVLMGLLAYQWYGVDNQ